MSIARWGRRVSIGVNTSPKWRGQADAERAVMHRAQADRSAKRQDSQGLGPEDESPVPAEQGCAQNTSEAS